MEPPCRAASRSPRTAVGRASLSAGTPALQEEWPYRRTVYLEFGQGDDGARRRLHNLGYSIEQPLADAVTSYEIDWREETSGELSSIEHEMRAWHDGGPPPSTSQVALDASVHDPNRIGTAVPLAASFEVWLTIEPIPNGPQQLSPKQLDIEWSASGSQSAPTESSRARDPQGNVVVKYVGVEAGQWSIGVGRRDAGLVAAKGHFAGVVNPPPSGGATKLRIQLEPLAVRASWALVPNVTEYGFDDSSSGNYKLLVDGKTDTLQITIDRPGSFKQVVFDTVPAGVVNISPGSPTGDTTQVKLTPAGGSGRRTTLRARVVLPWPGNPEFLAECELLVVDKERDVVVGPRVIQESTWVAAGHTTPTPDWASIEAKLRSIFKQAAVNISFNPAASATVAFDKHPKDGTLDLGSIAQFEDDANLNSKEADLIHAAAKDPGAQVSLYCLNRRPPPLFASIIGVAMGIPSEGCFFFPDAVALSQKAVGTTVDIGVLAAHEVGHSLGLSHDGRTNSLMLPNMELFAERLYANHWVKLNPQLAAIAPELTP